MNVEIFTPKKLGIEFHADETGDCFQDNAAIKSNKLFSITNMPSISDDSGICVEALGLGPGVHSARFGDSSFGDKERTLFLLEKMKNISNRNAYYHCTIAFTTSNRTLFFEGQCHGEIALDYSDFGYGFGYDPIFYYPPLKKRFSEITRNEKEKVSHRGIALRKFHDFLKTNSQIDINLK